MISSEQSTFTHQFNDENTLSIDTLPESDIGLLSFFSDDERTLLAEVMSSDAFNDNMTYTEKDVTATHFCYGDSMDTFGYLPGDEGPDKKVFPRYVHDTTRFHNEYFFSTRVEPIKPSFSERHCSTKSRNSEDAKPIKALPYDYRFLNNRKDVLVDKSSSYYSNKCVIPRTQMVSETQSINQSFVKMQAYNNTHLGTKLPYNGLCVLRNIPNECVNDVDVLFGRGKRTNNHPGNKNFRELVSRMASHYKDCTRIQKTALAESIVDAIHKKGGKFLNPSSGDSNLWVEMTGVALRKKTSQALRDSTTYRV